MRNVEVDSCDSPLFLQTRSEKLVELFDQISKINADIVIAREAANKALIDLEELRANVPEELKKAISTFDFFDDSVSEYEKKKAREGYLSIIDQIFYEVDKDAREWAQGVLAKALTARADSLNTLIEAHRARENAVVDLQTKLAEVTASANQVTEMQSCPVILRPADAEDYTNEVATPPVITSPPRQPFFFFDEPIPVDDSNVSEANSGADPEPSTDESTTSSVAAPADSTSSSSDSSTSSLPASSSSDSSTTSSIQTNQIPTESMTSFTIPTVTIPMIEIDPPKFYNPIVQNDIPINQYLIPDGMPTSVPTTSSIPTEIVNKRVIEIVNKCEDLVNEIVKQVETNVATTTTSIAPASVPDGDNLTLLSQASKDELPANAAPGSAPVKVDGFGYQPSSAVVIFDSKGTQVASVLVSEAGTVSAVVAMSPAVAADPVIVAGVNGNKKAVANLLTVQKQVQQSNPSATQDTGTSDSVADDAVPVDSTAPTAVGGNQSGNQSGMDNSSNTDSGGISTWLVIVLSVLVLAIVVALVRLRGLRASSHHVAADDSSREIDDSSREN